MAQQRDIAQDSVAVRRHMGIAPAPAFHGRTVAFGQAQERLVQRQSGNVGAAFSDRRLHHVAPLPRPVGIAEHALQKNGLDMGEQIGKGAKFIPDQSRLQGAHPGGIDQRFRQMFIHLAVPVCQQGQGALPQMGAGACGRGFA